MCVARAINLTRVHIVKFGTAVSPSRVEQGRFRKPGWLLRCVALLMGQVSAQFSIGGDGFQDKKICFEEFSWWGLLIECMAGQKSLAGLVRVVIGRVRRLCSSGSISWC